MNHRAVRIHDLESVRITEPGGEPAELELGSGRVSLLAPISGRRLDLAAIIECAFYGADAGEIDGIQEVELRFAGDAPIVLRRHFGTDAATLRIGGRLIDLEDASPGDHLLGLSRDAVTRALRIDGRRSLTDAVDVGVAGALERDVAVLSGLEAASEENLRLAALTTRIDAIRAELGSLPPTPELEYATSDPPALGELIAALEETREVERRLLGRRVDLADKLEEISKGNPSERATTPATLLDSLESSADEIDEIDERLTTLAAKAVRGGAYGIVTVTMILVIAACGLAVMGRELGDDLMFHGGLAAGAATLLGGLGAGLVRARTMVFTTKRLQALRERREDVRKKGLNTCRRVGAPANMGDITPEVLRRIADRARSRDAAREVQRAVAPLIDTPAELEMVRTLASSLEKPLAESGAPDAPAAPVVRASTAVVALAHQWVEHADATARRIEAAGRDRIAHETGRELLTQSLGHLEKERDGLQRKQEARTALTDSCRRLSERLDREVVPVLRRILGPAAPSGFTPELEPVGGAAADASNDAAILTVARLIMTEGLGATGLRIACDLTCGLGDDVSARLLEWCLTAPQAGRMLLAPRREADDRALDLHARDLAAAHAAVIEATPVRPRTFAPEVGETLEERVPETV